MKGLYVFIVGISLLLLFACDHSSSNQNWETVDFPESLHGTYIGERFCVNIPGTESFDSVLSAGPGEIPWDETALMNNISNFGGIHLYRGDYVVLIARDLNNWERPTHPRLEDVGFIACEVENSWAELLEIQDYVNKAWMQDPEKFENITSTGFRVVTNDLTVGLYELNEETIQFFKDNISDSPLISFEQGGRVILE